MEIDEISSRIQIEQVLYRYCRAVDRGDLDLLKSVYHEDAKDYHGPFDGLGRDFADQLVPRMDNLGVVGQHNVGNILIELTGDAANVESYFLAYHPSLINGSEDVGLAFAAGRYFDRFERRAGEWKIAERRVLIDLSEEPRRSSPWKHAALFFAGGRRAADPTFGAFSCDTQHEVGLPAEAL